MNFAEYRAENSKRERAGEICGKIRTKKIIRMWTAAAVLTVALIFLFIASRRMNTLSEIFFYQTGMGGINEYCGYYSVSMNIAKV